MGSQSIILAVNLDPLKSWIIDNFLQHSGTSAALVISEPYIVSTWQLTNLDDLLQALTAKSHVQEI